MTGVPIHGETYRQESNFFSGEHARADAHLVNLPVKSAGVVPTKVSNQIAAPDGNILARR